MFHDSRLLSKSATDRLMKEITDKELNQLIDIIYLFHLEKNQKQLTRFLKRLKALNKKYHTNELRTKVAILVDLLNIEFPDSEQLQFLRTILTANCDVILIGNKVMGFYAPPDQQIVPLPIPIHVINLSTHRILKVEFPGFDQEEIKHWQNLGFDEAVTLPYEHREIKGISVLVVKKLFNSNFSAQEHGFSPAVLIITPKTFYVWREIENSIENKKPIPELDKIIHPYQYFDF